MATLAGDHGFHDEHLMPYGRQVVNGYDAREEYSLRTAIAKKSTPFYTEKLEDKDKIIMTKEICLNRKDSAISESMISDISKLSEDGMASSESVRGFSVLNHFGKKGDKYWELVASLYHVGIADQKTVYDPTGKKDKVDMTYQIAGITTMCNFGPQTLKQGYQWYWDIPRSDEEAKRINEAIGRHEYKPKHRIVAFPRMYDPSHDKINAELMYTVLVEKKYPSSSDDMFKTKTPLFSGAVNFDKALRMIFALARIVNEADLEYVEDNPSAGSVRLKDGQKDKIESIVINAGLHEPSTRDDIKARDESAKKWLLFRRLLFGGAMGKEEDMVIKRDKIHNGLADGYETVIRQIQETAFNALFAAAADGDEFVRRRIMGTILSNAERGQQFDTFLHL